MFLRHISGKVGERPFELEPAIQGDQVDPIVFKKLASVFAEFGATYFDGYGQVTRVGQVDIKKRDIFTGGHFVDGKLEMAMSHQIQEAVSPWTDSVIAAYGLPPKKAIELSVRCLEVPDNHVSVAGWHADNRTIVTASDVLPTHTAIGSIPLSLGDRLRYAHSIEARDEFVSRQLADAPPVPIDQGPAAVQCVPLEAGYNYLLGPSVQHCEAPNTTGHIVERRFLRLGF
ncbi:MAG: hypothetical protein KIH63_005325 [Candidatus Saccharibacteria bacterium]|nr:hypothetical protein [Candidatus Saccharibacteria bacterium]